MYRKTIIIVLAALIALGQVKAQTTDTTSAKSHFELKISRHGITYKSKDGNEETGDSIVRKDKPMTSEIIFDLGINCIADRTNYNDANVKSYLNVPANRQNANLFKLNQNKSVNVNLYPFLESFRLKKTGSQKVFLTTGLGFQFYNFRYENNITYTRNPSTVILDSLNFTKNKVAMDYLNVPLMLTFKSKIYENTENEQKSRWLVYGVGITGGYGIAIWTKQKSGQDGKVKTHDDFSFNNFNSCLTFELGIEDFIRFYGSYQINSLYNNGIQQYPWTIGFRILGI